MISTPAATLLVATSNPGKRAEFANLLPPTIRVLGLADVSVDLPPEDGDSFAQIAAVKAAAASLQTGLLTLADDSGLEVDALAGGPGVRSARFAGEPPSDEQNRHALLDVLAGVPSGQRGARFRCAIALARAGTVVTTAEGTCEGSIGLAPRGTFGFGYDPIFVLPDNRTMAELESAEKNQISHRARAYQAILPRLFGDLGFSIDAEAGS